ncbi:MAG: hypothetical protein HY660_17100 [Armatimonadetes bacterium]|nr:hypothetical protein [Armatimonadota bacterium]
MRERRWREEAEYFGRAFLLHLRGPFPPGRYEVQVVEVRRGAAPRPMTRVPIRGRTLEEARDRVEEILRNLVGLERLHALTAAAAADVAPGAEVQVSETAATIYVDLGGAWALREPLALPRDAIDPALPEEDLAARIAAHLAAHLIRAAT